MASHTTSLIFQRSPPSDSGFDLLRPTSPGQGVALPISDPSLSLLEGGLTIYKLLSVEKYLL